MVISPIKVGAALKSMRNQDFDVLTAMCEVIDNSIQANAKNIKIGIEYSLESLRKKNRPVKIAFGDDGHGMDGEQQQLCLQLGYSGRYDDRKGIGRFGVGMTYAAISLCQKIEVYSRQRQGNWQYTCMDIRDTNPDEEPGITEIEQKSLPEEYANLVGDYGTLVIWSEIDRVDEPVKEDDVVHSFGRIYRKFIGDQIIQDGKAVTNGNKRSIQINGKIVNAFDPMYVTRSATYPDDETAMIDSEISFDWNVHPVDAPTSGTKQGTITIRTSLLPEPWRRVRAKVGRQGSGTSKENRRRKVNENEGISILRHGREVAYGPIPHMLSKDREVDRFWSCEIDFDPVLDHWFSVRAIKIGARPLRDLKDNLKKRIEPSVLRFRDRITKTMNEYDAKENESKEGPVHGHKDKEGELSQLTTPLPPTVPEETRESNTKAAADEAFSDPKEKEEYIEKISDPQTTYNIIEVHNMRSDGPFFEIIPDLISKTTHYNMNHAFFRDFYETVRKLKESLQDGNNEAAQSLEMVEELRGCLDNLFFAYGEAYYDLDDLDKTQKVGDTIDELLVKWNWHLRKIYKQHDQ